MNRFFVLPLLVLLAASASAISLELWWGDNIVHNTSSIEARLNVPEVGVKQYFTVDGVSENAGDAFVVSEAEVAGTVAYVEHNRQGDCTWTVYVSDTAVSLSNFNGHSVAENAEIKWAAEPNSETVTHCILLMDYNIMVS